MARGAKFGLGALVLAGVVAATGVATGANYSGVTFADVRGADVDGLVVAAKMRAKPRARLSISLHDVPLKASGRTRYLVTGDERPCSQVAGDFNADGDVDGADFLVWQTNIIMANTEGDFHVRKTTRLRLMLDSARSIRVYDLMTPQARQRACGAVQAERP